MSIFSLFSRDKKQLSVEQQEELAVQLLQETEALALSNPKKAIAVLRRKGKSAYDVFCIGGSMHSEFRDFVERMWARLGACEPIPSYAIEVICWDTWKSPTVHDLVERAQSTEADFLYLTPAPNRNPRDAIAELEALHLLVTPATAMVIVGEEGMFFQRSFIIEAGKQLLPDSEEIGEDMMDQAKALGLKVGMIVV